MHAANALAGGVAGSYGRFELDYWAAGATQALRQLEHRLDAAGVFAHSSPSLLICIPYREQMVRPILHENWRIELNPRKADFVIETERLRCAADVEDLRASVSLMPPVAVTFEPPDERGRQRRSALRNYVSSPRIDESTKATLFNAIDAAVSKFTRALIGAGLRFLVQEA